MMVAKKGLITAASTLAIAIGIGFVMQSGDSARTWYGSDPQSASVQGTQTSQAPVEIAQSSVLDVRSIELTAAEAPVAQAAGVSEAVSPAPEVVSPPSPIEGVVLAAATLDAVMEPAVTDVAPVEPECPISSSAQTLPGAIVKIELVAPCHSNERLTIHHSGMMFTETTGEDGSMTSIVPALAKDAVFILAFATGDGSVAQTHVPDLDSFDRTVLQWRGGGEFGLHAREFGADYGSDGHIWSGGERDLSGIANGDSGFILQVGEADAPEPLLAEIYSFPSAKSAFDGTIDLSVEAEVTQANCGKEIEAQTLERQSDGTIKSQDLVLSVPDCSAVGDFMVLNNLVSDLKVAAIN